jgi:hypothetical protein
LRLLAVSLLALPALGASQVRLVIEIAGAKAGYATISQKLLPDGVKQVEMKMELRKGEEKTRVVSQSSFAKDGSPQRKFQETFDGQGRSTGQVVVSFDEEGAQVVTILDGERTVIKRPLVATGNRKNVAEFWFIQAKPTAGALSNAFLFDLNALAWDLTTTKYLGVQPLSFDGLKFSAHALTMEKGSSVTKVWVDDDGLPILIDQGRVKMKRFKA